MDLTEPKSLGRPWMVTGGFAVILAFTLLYTWKWNDDPLFFGTWTFVTVITGAIVALFFRMDSRVYSHNTMIQTNLPRIRLYGEQTNIHTFDFKLTNYGSGAAFDLDVAPEITKMQFIYQPK